MTQIKLRKAKLCALLLFGIGLTGLRAQEAIPAAGGVAAGSGGSADYSIGQLMYTSETGTNGSVTQGVQQPYEISVITGLNEYSGIYLSCSVYPNPATDFLTLKIEGDILSQYVAFLYDLNGKLLLTKQITSNETRIDMGKLIIATYFLKIVQTEEGTSVQHSASPREIKTFKIIKN